MGPPAGAREDDSGDEGNASQEAGEVSTNAAAQPPPGDGGDESGNPSDSPNEGDGRDGGSDAPPSHDPSGTGRGHGCRGPRRTRLRSSGAPVDTAAEQQAWDEAMHQALSSARVESKALGLVADTVRNAHASKLD